MELERTTIGEACHVVLRGALDRQSAPQLRAAVAEAVLGGAREVVVDLRHLEHVDDDGLRAVGDAAALADEAGVPLRRL